ncbi:hypothetical protein PG987_010537 [Apiospora arundinis]
MQLLKFIIAVIAGFQYITGALGAWRYVIDKPSCAGNLHDSVKSLMDTVQQWAHEVCDTFAPYINDPSQRPDDRVMDLTTQIFGNNNMETIVDLYNRFNRIRSYQYYEIDNRDWTWAQQRDNSDLEIFCSGDHIVMNHNAIDPSVMYWDITRSCPIANDDLLLVLHEEDVLESAVTCSATPEGDQQVFPEHWSEYIAFHPAYLQDAVNSPYTFADRIEAAKSPALLHLARTREQDPIRRERITPFDLLLAPEQVFLHEMTHLVTCGASLDIAGPDSYGWVAIRTLQNIHNADNLAAFAMIHQFNRHYNIKVSDSGKLRSIS